MKVHRERNFVTYSSAIKIAFFLYILVGLAGTAWLLLSERVWLPTGDGVYIDRVEDPYLFWILIGVLFLTMILWPLWELWRGGTYRK